MGFAEYLALNLDFPVPRKLQVYFDFTLLSLYLDCTFCSRSPTSPLASDGIPKDLLLNITRVMLLTAKRDWKTENICSSAKDRNMLCALILDVSSRLSWLPLLSPHALPSWLPLLSQSQSPLTSHGCTFCTLMIFPHGHLCPPIIPHNLLSPVMVAHVLPLTISPHGHPSCPLMIFPHGCLSCPIAVSPNLSRPSLLSPHGHPYSPLSPHNFPSPLMAAPALPS